jgi:hypothetical protein
LIEPQERWPALSVNSPPDEELPEARAKAIRSFCGLVSTSELPILTKYSSFDKAVRIAAYYLRFAGNCKKGNKHHTGPLLVSELHAATNILARAVQMRSFQVDIRALKKNCLVATNSPLSALAPFIDDDGLIRVGGRLSNSNASPDVRHPIVLPPKHPLTRALILKTHILLLHGGAQAVL